MTAIFLLPVCLTYWPRKYTTRVDPTSIIATKFEVDMSIHCRVITTLCWYVTWPCDLDLWPFNLEQLSYMAGHMTNSTTKYEVPTPIRSWVTSYNGSHWLPLKMRTRPLRMRRITWPVSRGSKTITFLESTTPIYLFSVQLLLGYDDDWRSLKPTLEPSNVKAVFGRKNFVPSKWGHKMAVFFGGGKWWSKP